VPDRGPPSIPQDRRPNTSLRDAVKLVTVESSFRGMFRGALDSSSTQPDQGTQNDAGLPCVCVASITRKSRIVNLVALTVRVTGRDIDSLPVTLTVMGTL
jgi:hypothetical protein